MLAWMAEPHPGKVPASDFIFASNEKPARVASAPMKPAPRGLSADLDFHDPETTGSVPAPAPKKDGEKAEAEAKAKAEAARMAEASNKAGVLNGTAPPVSPAERALLERLGERREAIDARMRELEMRERLLDTAEKKLDGRLGDLKELESKAGSPASKQQAEEAKAIKNLVIMYEAMKPKDAARVFDRLGLDVLVPVVQQMNPRKMSEVLAAMAPDRAEKLTVALASMARNPGADRATIDPASLPGTELPAITPAPRR
jgi:flagellar motility protein MotE (MotC chaperone)